MTSLERAIHALIRATAKATAEYCAELPHLDFTKSDQVAEYMTRVMLACSEECADDEIKALRRAAAGSFPLPVSSN